MSRESFATAMEENRKRRYSGDAQGDTGKRSCQEVPHAYGNTYASDNARVHLGDVHEHNYHYHVRGGHDAHHQALTFLSYPHMHDRFHAISEATAGTYAWLSAPETIPTSFRFEKERRSDEDMAVFRQWLNAGDGIFWVTGKPGSGKSCLMKHLVEQLIEDAHAFHDLADRHMVPLVLSHFFWINGEPLQRNIEGCMRSLLVQLVADSRSRELALQKIGILPNQYLTTKRLYSIIRDILGELPVPLFALIDGLDECESYRDQHDVLRLLRSRRGDKLCISSRPEPEFLLKFGDAPTIKMQDINARDIKQVIEKDFLSNELVRKVVARNASKNINSDLDRLIDMIQYKAEGVFIWVVLVIRQLISGITNRDSLEQLQRRVKAFPSEIGELYRSMLKRNNDHSSMYTEEASLYLRLVLHRSFTLAEFCFMDDTIREKCFGQIQNSQEFALPDIDLAQTITWIQARTGGLLEIQSSYVNVNNTNDEQLHKEVFNVPDSVYVDFIHRTVSDFLLNDPQGLNILGDQAKLSTRLEKVCRETRVIKSWVLPLISGKIILSREVFAMYSCGCREDATILSTMLVIRTIFKLLVEKNLVIGTTTWNFCDKNFENWERLPEIFPLNADLELDFVPFLLATGYYDLAVRILNDTNYALDDKAKRKLAVPLIYRFALNGENKSTESAARLILAGETNGANACHLDGGDSFPLAHHIVDALIEQRYSREYKEIMPILKKYNIDLMQNGQASCWQMSQIWKWWHRTDPRYNGEQGIEFWGEVTAMETLAWKRGKNSIDTRQITPPPVPKVIATISGGHYPELRALTLSTSVMFAELLREMSQNRSQVQLRAPAIGMVNYYQLSVPGRSAKNHRLLSFSQKIKEIRELSPVLPSFVAAMEYLGKTKETILHSYELKSKVIMSATIEQKESLKKWYWGDQDPSIYLQTPIRWCFPNPS